MILPTLTIFYILLGYESVWHEATTDHYSGYFILGVLKLDSIKMETALVTRNSVHHSDFDHEQ